MLALGVLLSCTRVEEKITEVENAEIETRQYSIILLADPHVSNDGEHRERLSRTVDWINAHQEEEQIEVVFILGDVGWGEGLEIAKEELLKLNMPFVPVIGDNEVHFGDEMRFFDVFSDVYTMLRNDLQIGMILLSRCGTKK